MLGNSPSDDPIDPQSSNPQSNDPKSNDPQGINPLLEEVLSATDTGDPRDWLRAELDAFEENPFQALFGPLAGLPAWKPRRRAAADKAADDTAAADAAADTVADPEGKAPNPDAESADPTATQKNLGGRPEVLDAKKRGVVCALITVGLSRRMAARHVGCSPQTITNLIARDPQFREEMQQAESRRVAIPLASIHRWANRSWRAAAWLYKHVSSRPSHTPGNEWEDQLDE